MKMLLKERNALKYTFLILSVLAIGFAFIPQAALGACSSDITQNYTECLKHYYNVTTGDENTKINNALYQCSCCVVNLSDTEKNLSELCQSQNNISNCNKPIGVAIKQINNINLILNGDVNHPIYNSSCNNCCNVGILVGNQLENQKWNNVYLTIRNVTVNHWNTGIMLWRLGEGGEGHGATIENSTIINNVYGIYFWGSVYNKIISNNLSNNSEAGILLNNLTPPQGGGTSSNNLVYNNYLNNSLNAAFVGGASINTWNTTAVHQDNIIGGNYIGGNFWANLTQTGYSELDLTCNCNSTTGFCNNPYQLNSFGPNLDNLPLCKVSGGPYIGITITSIANWQLEVGLNPNALQLDVDTNSGNWTVSVEDRNDSGKPPESVGKMAEYTPETETYFDVWLQNPLEMRSVISGNYINLTGGRQTIVQCSSNPSCSKNYPIPLRQEVEFGDQTLPSNHVYRIVITFVGMTT